MANLKLKENLDIKSTGVSTSGKNALPKTGDIIPFAGTVAPTGWVICDGTNGTPDLRGYFLVGASSSANIGATYGNTNHTHTTSVAAYGIDNTIVSGTHGYNSVTPTSTISVISGISAYAIPTHSHTSPFTIPSANQTMNIIANSNSAAGPIAFNNQTHSHSQSGAITSTSSGSSNHTHAGTTVNMNTSGYHGYNSTNGSYDQSHSITSNLSGNLTDPGKQYQPFIIMNYIMKV